MANLIITVKFAPSECFCGKEEINYISTSSLLQVFSLFGPRETLFTFCKVWIGLLITVQSDLKKLFPSSYTHYCERTTCIYRYILVHTLLREGD